jgi:hypothetical protein
MNLTIPFSRGQQNGSYRKNFFSGNFFQNGLHYLTHPPKGFWGPSFIPNKVYYSLSAAHLYPSGDRKGLVKGWERGRKKE